MCLWESSGNWKIIWWFRIHRFWAILAISLISFSGTGIRSQVFKLTSDKTFGNAGKRVGGECIVCCLLQIGGVSKVFRSTTNEMSTMSHPND